MNLKMQRVLSKYMNPTSEYSSQRMGRNSRLISAFRSAIEAGEIGIVPSEEKLARVIELTLWGLGTNATYNAKLLAKEVRELMLGDDKS